MAGEPYVLEIAWALPSSPTIYTIYAGQGMESSYSVCVFSGADSQLLREMGPHFIRRLQGMG